MVCSNPLIVDTRPIYAILTPQVISRMISEDNLVNWRRYTETICLDYDTPTCPIVVFGSDEIFSICLWYQISRCLVIGTTVVAAGGSPTNPLNINSFKGYSTFDSRKGIVFKKMQKVLHRPLICMNN